MKYHGYTIETNGAMYRAYKLGGLGRWKFFKNYIHISYHSPDITSLHEMKKKIDEEIAHRRKFNTNWQPV